jgi:hypothetical protein
MASTSRKVIVYSGARELSLSIPLPMVATNFFEGLAEVLFPRTILIILLAAP